MLARGLDAVRQARRRPRPAPARTSPGRSRERVLGVLADRPAASPRRRPRPPCRAAAPRRSAGPAGPPPPAPPGRPGCRRRRRRSASPRLAHRACPPAPRRPGRRCRPAAGRRCSRESSCASAPLRGDPTTMSDRADLLGEVVQAVRGRRRGDDPVLAARPAALSTARRAVEDPLGRPVPVGHPLGVDPAGPIAAGAGCDRHDDQRRIRGPGRPRPRTSASSPESPPSTPTTTGPSGAAAFVLTHGAGARCSGLGRLAPAARRTRRGPAAAGSGGSRTRRR